MIICILKPPIHQKKTNIDYVFVVVEAVCVSGSLHTPRFSWWSGQAWLF